MLGTWVYENVAKIYVLGEGPQGIQAERNDIRASEQLRGWVGPTSWLGRPSLYGRAGFGQRGLKTSEPLYNIFKEREWWAGKRETGKAEG